MNTVEILTAAYELIEPDGAWTQRAGARSKTGLTVSDCDENAVCWCSSGALIKFDANWAAFQYLRMAIQTREILRWNDDPLRTHGDVREAFRKAIALAKAADPPTDAKGLGTAQ